MGGNRSQPVRNAGPGRRTAVVLMVVLASAWLAVAVSGGSQRAGAQAEQAALAGTLWRVVSYNDQGTMVDVLPATPPTASFGVDGILSGTTGCNSYQAAYTTAGSSITIGPVATTLRACLSDASAAQESAFLTALSASASFTVAGDELTLADAAGVPQLVLVQQALTLGGAPWLVVAYNNGRGAVVSVMSGSVLTALFGDDGIVSGETGCNTYQATYAVSGPTVAIGPIATTRRACSSDDLATQEASFLAALSASTRYEFTGEELTLRASNGAAQVNLVRPAQSQQGVLAQGTIFDPTTLSPMGSWVGLNDGALWLWEESNQVTIATPCPSLTGTADYTWGQYRYNADARLARRYWLPLYRGVMRLGGDPASVAQASGYRLAKGQFLGPPDEGGSWVPVPETTAPAAIGLSNANGTGFGGDVTPEDVQMTCAGTRSPVPGRAQSNHACCNQALVITEFGAI